MARVVASTRMLPTDVVAAVELLFNNGFDLIDVNYASMERMDIDYPSVPSVTRYALLKAALVGAKPVTLHAPWEDYFLLYLGRGVEHAVNEAKIFLDIAGNYGVEVVVFHGFSARRVGSYRVEWINKRFFSTLADYAEREDLPIIAIENSSRSKPLNKIEALRDLLAQIDSPKLRACIDTGHANLNGYSIIGIDNAISPLEPVCIHVHDNHGSRDEHLRIGCGSIKWSEAGSVKTLPRARYIVLESDCSSTDIDVCLDQARIEANNARSVLKEWVS